MNYLQELKHDTTRGIVISTRMGELPIKEHRGWKYINYCGTKIGLARISVLQPPDDDPVFDYVFGGGSVEYPCPAMDYWIMRWRMKRKITTEQYKRKFMGISS